MAFNYSTTANNVKNILAKFGQTVTITKRVAGEYDPETGEVSIAESDYNALGCVFDYGTKNIDGTTIKEGDQQLYLQAVGIEIPEVDYKVLVGSVSYTITKIKILSPAGTPVLLECNIRP